VCGGWKAGVVLWACVYVCGKQPRAVVMRPWGALSPPGRRVSRRPAVAFRMLRNTEEGNAVRGNHKRTR